MRGVPTGMKWNAVEWWNTAVHAPAFLLSSPLLVPFFSFSFSFFLPLLLLLFPPFNRAPEQSRAPLSRPFLAPVDRVPSCRFPLASYVRNEPQLIHHNRFTCISAGTFTLPPLSLSSIPPLVDVPLSLSPQFVGLVLVDLLEILFLDGIKISR